MGYLLQHLLADSAARSPEREALRYEGRSLGYGELEVLSNRLARSLRRAGIRQGDRVGLLLPKTPPAVIGVFAALKAGAVYVPLDHSSPTERLAYIVENCGVRALLTSTGKLAEAAQLCRGSKVTALITTDDGPLEPPQRSGGVRIIGWHEVLAESDAPLAASFDASFDAPATIDTDLAVILYTSGSTGAPKGVMLSHRAVLTFVTWSTDTFGLTPDDRVTSHAPLHFDLSTFDIYATVKAGGTIVLVPEGLPTLPQRLADLLQDEQITTTYLVPSALTLLALYGGLETRDLSRLRNVLFAGEVFPVKHLRRLVSLVPGARYFNLYGPTETNVCTYYQVTPADIADEVTGNVAAGPVERARSLPIGRACLNTATFALADDGSQVTRPGQEGELWVRGSCLASGYWGDAQATGARFVQNPLRPDFPETAYRTGDIVALADDGENWLYRGRRDLMIKSRGHRVEMGDIEAALYRHAQVKAAVAVAVPDDVVGNRIVAFAVPVAPGAVSEGELRRHCASLLPRYMLPERVELRPSLPTTSSGKFDRALLARGSTPSARDPEAMEVGDERRG